ncbi:MAG: SDR family NAD(P)-dependent oxidoreductase [Acidobacteriota bacterium]|nr:SDR family NAD(P)-dependent oxidoreductase [Acidobacteriota bacterium]
MNDALGMPQSAVVIGGSSEIAAALLRALAAERLSRVVLGGRQSERLEAAAKELGALGVEVHTDSLDVTDVGALGPFAAGAASRLGDIDLVVVAAGVLGDQDTDAADPVAAARVFETNTTGPVAALTAFAEVLRRQGHGRIVVFSSVAGVRVRRANYVYGASKAGLDGFAQGLSDALEGTGVGVTIVRPGWVATRMTAGREPAPFATTPDAVAADVVAGLRKGAAVVWSPPLLKLAFAVFRLLPGALWRRMPG